MREGGKSMKMKIIVKVMSKPIEMAQSDKVLEKYSIQCQGHGVQIDCTANAKKYNVRI